MPSLRGVNLPWFFGAYGHDLAPNERHPSWGTDFDVMGAYRPLVEAAAMGFQAVRVWLCENGEGVVTRDGEVTAPHPGLLESVRVLQECARLCGLKVYWTLLDANSWAREGDALTHSIVADPRQRERFAARVAAPLAALFDPAVTLAVEVLNEPEAMTAECMPDRAASAVPWETLAATVRVVGDAVRAARPGTLVTAGTMHVFLPRLWACEPGVDAVDVHIYHAHGGLPSRDDLARYVGDARLLDPALPLLAGECGIPDEPPGVPPGDPPGDPPLEPYALRNYLHNAESRGYAAAFLWRFEGVLVDATHAPWPATALGAAVRRTLAELAGIAR